MTKSQILALAANASPRLILATDEGKYYGIPAGSSGASATALGGDTSSGGGDPSLRFGNKFAPLIIITGESNAAGDANNSDATGGELSPRAGVQILNNTTLLLENLDIGANNTMRYTVGNTPGVPLTDLTLTHGMELQLANRVGAGDWLNNPVYLMKCAHGGSTIGQWSDGSVYWDTFVARYAAIKGILDGLGKLPLPYIWYSQGINDFGAGTSIATWKAATIAHIAKIRALIGFAPILMTRFSSDYATITEAIDEIAAEVPLVFAIDTEGAPKKNTAHWDYLGQKQVSNAMVDCCLTTIGEHYQYLLSNYYMRIIGKYSQLAEDVDPGPGGTPGELILNGNFSEGTFDGSGSLAAIPGWVENGNVYAYVVTSSDEYYTMPTGVYPGHVAIFNGINSAVTGSVQQNITTVVGQSYTLTYWIGALKYNSTVQQAQLEVTGASSLLNLTDTPTVGGGDGCYWTARTRTFVADSTTTNVKFTDASAGTNGVDLLITAVSVVATP